MVRKTGVRLGQSQELLLLLALNPLNSQSRNRSARDIFWQGLSPTPVLWTGKKHPPRNVSPNYQQKTSLALCTLWHRWKNKKSPVGKAVLSTQTGAGLQDSTKRAGGDKARNCGCLLQRRTEVDCCIVRKWSTEDSSKSPGSLAEIFFCQCCGYVK